ncbi:MAG: nitroreductase [Deltaproteobacteria bacterium]|nr:nitroreductase [Deltaproteobacteria bacterium]
MELFEVIKNRRSIRKYKPDMPTDQEVEYILEAARCAPSWANTQCWEFILVRDPELKLRLADTLPEKNPARKAIIQAPIVIAACALKEVSGYYKGTAVTDKGDWLLFDSALALQNLTLAAYEQGLGTLHTGFFDSQKAAEILKVPEQVALVELLPLGYPDQQGVPTKRKPLEAWVFDDVYGRKGNVG